MKYVLCILVLIVAGCSDHKPPVTKGVPTNKAGVYKFVDENEGVVCYTFYSNGISCVKRSKK